MPLIYFIFIFIYQIRWEHSHQYIASSAHRLHGFPLPFNGEKVSSIIDQAGHDAFSCG